VALSQGGVMARRDRYRTTGVLAILVLVAAVAAIWSSRRVPDSVREERHGKLLPSLRREQITRIEFASPTEQFTVFKENGRWFLAQNGRRNDADESEIERILTEAEFASPARHLGRLDAHGRDRFGLAHPRMRVTLREAHDVSQSFAVGGAVSDESNAYVEVDGTGYVVSGTLADAFARTALDLRDRTLSEIDTAHLTRLELDGEGGHRVLEQANGVWRLTTPAEGRVKRSRIDSMLHDLRDMRATRFVADDASAATLARYGLATPVVTLRAVRSAGAPIEWRFGGACGSYSDEVAILRADRAAVACVGRAVFDNVRAPTDELRDDKILWARTDEVERVRVHATSGEFSLVRDHDHWRAEGGSGDADSDAIEAWLTTLGNISTEARLDANTASTHGLEPVARWIEVTRTGIEGSERLEIGDNDADHLYVRRSGETAVLGLDPSTADNLRIDGARFRSRQLVRDVADEMSGLITDAPTFHDATTRVAGEWQLTVPVQAPGDATTIRAAATRLASLDADRWVALVPAAAHGLTTPRYRIVARFEGVGPESVDAGPDGGRPRVREYTLSIGAAAPGGGAYASMTNRPGVFVLSQTAVDELAQPHVARSLVETERNAIDRIEITRPHVGAAGQDHIVVHRDGDVWRTDAGQPADRTRVEALLSRLVLVQATRAIGYGAAGADQHIGDTTLTLTLAAAPADGGHAQPRTIRLLLGAPFGEGADASVYARRDGLDATLAVSRDVADAVRDYSP
jgi:hypothetical protein